MVQLLVDFLAYDMTDLEVRTVKFPDSVHHYIESANERCLLLPLFLSLPFVLFQFRASQIESKSRAFF